jgi:ligand-binding sensor domain-containing protein/signal transduction histidine kinase/DNA-binding response OmpR family regulator
MRLRLSILIFFIILARQFSAMPFNYRFRHLTSSDGLPYQQVQTVLQDANGYIWIGTRNGLSRYDGYEIKTYFHDERNKNSLCGNFIDFLFMDSKKRVWVCSENEGICRYNAASDNFHQYKENGVTTMLETHHGKIIYGGNRLCIFDEKKDKFIPYPIFEQSQIISLAIDRYDNLYVATHTDILRYNSTMTKITRLNTADYKSFLTGSDDIVPIITDSRGRLWIGRNGDGVMSIDLSTGAKTIYKPQQISNGTVRTINEDKQHRIWLGTEKGITIINPDGRIEIITQHFQRGDGLSDNAIYSIISDVAGNVWIGSYFGGVDMLPAYNNNFNWAEPGYDVQNIKGKVPRMMVETSPGIFWIATEDGGINIYNSHTGSFTLFNKIPKIGTNVHSLYFDRKSSDLWIGTFRNGLYRYNLKTGKTEKYELKYGPTSNSVFNFAHQQDGRLWIATTQGLRYYDEKTRQFRTTSDNTLNTCFVYSLLTDRDGNIWAGTVHNGLFRIDRRTGKIKNWKKGIKTGLNDNYIVSLYQDRFGKLWIGTNTGGLQYYNPQTDKMKSVSNEVLPGNSTVCSIIDDKLGNLWVSTGNGLFKYSPENKHTICFTTEDGLPINQFNFSSSLLASDGRLFFGTVDGLVFFNPLQIKARKGPFRIHWKKLIIGNQEINASIKDSPLTAELDNTTEIRLSYSQAHSFSIEYGVIMPGNTDGVKYQVMFEGVDKEWRDVGLERKFYGYNLQPRTYILHVRANNSNAGWNNCPEKTIEIVVRPPFYRSLFAYILYFITIILACGFSARLITTRIRERNAVRIANMEKQKLEEMDKEKFDFFTTVSHELKTPLSLIVAPLKSISREGLSDRSRKNLDVAVKNTGKMEELINELVTFNKIETGNFPFYIQKGNPLEFIELAASQYRETAREKDITLKIECENNGEEVWFSPSYVERILGNLLSNAFKFTANGGDVTVNACITTKINDTNTYLLLSVSDTGIGIAKEELSNIFTRYYQTKRGYNANNKGWGIGLSLVKRLTDIHKGSVSVDSKIGEGSVFTVYLNVSPNAFDAKCCISEDKVIVPISKYKFASHEYIPDYDDNKNGTTAISEDKVSILIVDDNKDLLDFLRDSFSEKYNVYTAEDGKKALKVAHEKDIQLVVSDIMMPEMNGIELCKTLKHDVATSHIPVILLTAKSGSDDVVTGYESGAEAYVSKPFDPQILELQIKNIISLQKARQNEVAVTDGSNIDVTSLNEIDKDLIRRLNMLIDENIANSDFSISDVTQALAISRSLLYTKMKNLVNMSAGDYVRKKRLDKACQMLREGNNVSETAYSTGFADPNYFSKTFKKNFGISPTEYIDELHKG